MFFAHWCSRIARSQAFSGAVRSRKLRAGTTPAARSPRLSAAVGLATIGSRHTFRMGRSGEALPM